MILRHSLLLLALTTLCFGACEREGKEPSPTPPPLDPAPAPGEADGARDDATADPGRAEPAPPPPPLPEFEPYEPAELRLGSRRLTDCAAFNGYLKDALIDHQLRNAFPQDVGQPIGAAPSRAGEAGEIWAHEGDWLYYAASDRLHAVEVTSTPPVHHVAKIMSPQERILAVNEDVVVTAFARQRRGARFISFDAPGGPPKTRQPDGDYDAPTTMWGLYVRDDRGVSRRAVIDTTGAPGGVTFHDGALYLILRDKLHVARRTLDDARRRTKLGREPVSTEAALRGFVDVRAGDRGTPAFGLVRIADRDVASEPRMVGCKNVWVPEDTASRGDELITVLRVVPSRWEVRPVAAITGRDMAFAAVDGDLIVVRRLRGRVVGDAKERPVSQVETFRLGTSLRPGPAKLVDGVPVRLFVREDRGWLLTTRWPESETLAFAIDRSGDGFDVAEPATLPPDAELPSYTATDRLPLHPETLDHAVIAPVTEKLVIGIDETERALALTVLDSDGREIGGAETDPSIQVLRWKPETVVSGPGVIAAPIAALDAKATDLNLLVGRVDRDRIGVTLHRPVEGFNPIGGFVRGDYYVALSREGVDWITFEGTLSRSRAWSAADPVVEIVPPRRPK